MTFFGESRVDPHVAHHIHESPKIMTVPLMVLAFLSVVGGYVGIPHVLGGANHIHEFLAPVVGGGAEPAKAHAGITLLAQAWASGGEVSHSAARFQWHPVAIIHRDQIAISSKNGPSERGESAGLSAWFS
jgi:NADH:ubiquinone oxidoreductase subunit 5 (subunit L)/multisubunit Na+/H+ antiporter MnhA subunit